MPPDSSHFATTPFRSVHFGPVATRLERREDGSMLYRSLAQLEAYPGRLTEKLIYWAEATPDRVFAARRDGAGRWRTLNYAETLVQVRSIGQALLDRNLSSELTIAILSENSLEHLLLALAAMHVGIPYAPISPAYSLVSRDFGKLRYTLDVMRPGLIFAQDGERYERALSHVVPQYEHAEVVTVEHPLRDRACTSFESLMGTTPTLAVDVAFDRVGPDSIAKVLFTSGSTGSPKGVVNTQRMLCANLQQIVQAMPFIAEKPPLIVDWLPWNHTFGGNHNVGLMLYNGGTLYIDDGKPTPEGIATTVANLRELAPTMYFNVPKGFDELLGWLRRDPSLAEIFFSRLQMLFYAGASLPQHVRDGLAEVALQTCGERIPIITGLGMTEAGPSAMFAHWPGGYSGLVGVPVPGLDLKLAPYEDKIEVRYRGPNITPGYWREPEITAKSFDEEGFFRTGDGVRLVDAADPDRGLLFDGRIAEDFKLTTGAWVNAGILRLKLLKAGLPLVRDAVITGHDRDYIGALLFLNEESCRVLAGDVSLEVGWTHSAVVGEIKRILDELLEESTGSSNRILRAVVAVGPPSIDVGEITDKGSLNQRVILRHRADLVEELYAEPKPVHVISVRGPASGSPEVWESGVRESGSPGV